MPGRASFEPWWPVTQPDPAIAYSRARQEMATWATVGRRPRPSWMALESVTNSKYILYTFFVENGCQTLDMLRSQIMSIAKS